MTFNVNEKEVKKYYEGQLTKNMSGSLYDMVSPAKKVLMNCKTTVLGNFQGHSGAQCITCSYKASSGLLCPLEQGFIYVHKPPMHIRFSIQFVNFAHGIATTHSFDLEIETKQGSQYTFSSTEREEYGKLFHFSQCRKLIIKNHRLKDGMNPNYEIYADSNEDQHDAYLEQVKEEVKIQEKNAKGSNNDLREESNEPFNPGEEEEM